MRARATPLRCPVPPVSFFATLRAQRGFGPAVQLPAMDAQLERRIVERILARFDPLQIILFGSHARGDAGPDSDVDLIVVFRKLDDRIGRAVEIRNALEDLDIDEDVFATTPQAIEKGLALPGHLFRYAIPESRVLYERTT